MKKLVSGILVPMTDEEIRSLELGLPVLTYKDRVVNKIREVYSIDDEIAIIRQRNIKPEEFRAYNDFVEAVKAKEKIE